MAVPLTLVLRRPREGAFLPGENPVTDLKRNGDLLHMTSNESDAELLARSASEPTVFGEIYERHGVAVRRYVVSRVGLSSGEDLTADVFARAFRARGRCRADGGSALPWLLGMANHVIGDHRRLERRRLAAMERLLARGEDVVETSDRGLTSELVHALRRLSAADRDTLLLLVWGELSRVEVAVALGVPVGTVNSRVARARKRLAVDLKPSRQSAHSRLIMNGEHDG